MKCFFAQNSIITPSLLNEFFPIQVLKQWVRGYQKTSKVNRAAYEHSSGATYVSLSVFQQYCLELYNPKGQKIKACKTENKGRVVQGKHQSYKLSAASAEERDNWIDAIRWAADAVENTWEAPPVMFVEA